MKTIKELADIGAASAFDNNRRYHYMSVSEQSHSWIPDEPARQAFAAAVRDAMLADLVTKPDSSPTFEAHSFTWTRHKPGEPMPCNGETMVNWLTRHEEAGEPYKHRAEKASNLSWGVPVGWRYAEPTTPVTKTAPLMIPTPRTDKHMEYHEDFERCDPDFARTLETELTHANNRAHNWEQATIAHLKDKDQLHADIAELNDRLIDRQKTLMAALTENQNLKRELAKANQHKNDNA